MRGEHLTGRASISRNRGSSPHARGTQRGRDMGYFVIRLIPACAGNTRWQSPTSRRRTAHPRMRGEHISVLVPPEIRPGSSPHARGTRRGRSSSRPGRTAHPRMRGEHAGTLSNSAGQCGSSPHARGTPFAARTCECFWRLIPACAGNTLAAKPAGVSYGGSSPHARGTLGEGLSHCARPRLIPACAGNTAPCPGCCSAASAHPRMRGEHGHPQHAVPAVVGSSPHARGTHLA